MLSSLSTILGYRLTSALASLHRNAADLLSVLPAAFLRDAVARGDFQRGMVLRCADAGEVKWMAADGASFIGQAFKTTGRHCLSFGETLRWVCFAEGAQSGEFFSLGLAVVWRWKSGGEPSDGESQDSGELHCGLL